jgi:hypothetical protein
MVTLFRRLVALLVRLERRTSLAEAERVTRK